MPAGLVLLLLLTFGLPAGTFAVGPQVAGATGSGDAPAVSGELNVVLAELDSVSALDAQLLVSSREGNLPDFLEHSREKRIHCRELREELLKLLDRQDPQLAVYGAALGPFLLEQDSAERTLRVLLPFIETIPDTVAEKGYFCLTAGLLLRLEQKHAHARLYFEAASTTRFPLAAHALYLAVESAAATGEMERALELLSKLESSGADAYLLSRARFVAGLALLGSRLEQEAAVILEGLQGASLGSVEEVRVAQALGALYEKSSDYSGAAKSYARAFEKATYAEEAVDASRAYLRLVRERKTRVDEPRVLSAARCLERTGNGLEAKTVLENLFANGQGSLQAGWQLARLFYRVRRYSDAAAVFEKLENKEKRAGDALRARLWVARCKRQLYRTEEAMDVFRQVSISGRRRVSVEAAWELGMELESLGRLDEAVEAYDSLYRRFPRNRLACEGLFRKGLCEYKQGNLERAGATFESAARLRVPDSLHDMAAFWSLKCAFEAGKGLSSDELKRHEARGETLYSILLKRASEKGEVQADFFRKPWQEERFTSRVGDLRPAGPDAGEDSGSSPSGDVDEEGLLERSPDGPELAAGLPAEVEAAVGLIRFGLRTLAREELLTAQRELSGDSRELFFMAQLYWRNDFYREALSLADRLMRTGRGLGKDEKRFLKRMLYPIYNIEIVLEESRSQGVDPFLVLSVMRRESTFDPDATSPAGATGVMQLMPHTAGEIAAYLGEEHPGSGLKDPDLNIRYGVWLLGKLKGKYGDSVVAALAAYNAGEYNADRWLEAVEPSDEFVYMESVSFRETREYLHRVLSDLHVYTTLYVR